MAVWQYSFFIVPKLEVENKYGQIPLAIDSEFHDEFVGWQGVSVDQVETILAKNFGNLSPTGYGPLVFGREDGSCVSLLFNGCILENVTVRLDLRQTVADQIKDAIKLCELLDGILVTSDNRTIPCHDEDLIASIKDSSAVKFVKNPQDFFASLESNKKA